MNPLKYLKALIGYCSEKHNSTVPIPKYTPPNNNVGPIIVNNNFSCGWDNCTPVGQLINQEPVGWRIDWQRPRERLYDSTKDRAEGVPFCQHILTSDLLPEQQKDGEDAFILSGDAVYRISHNNASFGAELSQTIEVPSGSGTISGWIRTHIAEEVRDNIWAVEVRLYANGMSQKEKWINQTQLKHGEWRLFEQPYNLDCGGSLHIRLRVKSKYSVPVSFYIDDLNIKHNSI